MDTTVLILGALSLAIGGILKGAVGAGAPLFVIPVLAIVHDVPFAVAIYTVPSLTSNIWQAFTYRKHASSPQFVWRYALAGGAGAGVGSVILASVPGEALLAGLATVVFLYIGFRVFRPGWVLARDTALRYAVPVGFVGGMMQGAGGISAPVSITFLNAMRLERGEFIATISVFFAMMSAVQIPSQAALGIMTGQRFFLSVLACIPLFGTMPAGVWLGKRVSKEQFDRLILWLLAAIALKLLWDALA